MYAMGTIYEEDCKVKRTVLYCTVLGTCTVHTYKKRILHSTVSLAARSLPPKLHPKVEFNPSTYIFL